jgi:glycyl-tRNA synthetase beta chain
MAANEALLVELFTEELPPKALRQLGEAFAAGITQGLAVRGLVDKSAVAEAFASPRRLAVRLAAVPARGADRAESRKLMPAKVAFAPDGSPTPALQKRLEKEQAQASQLVRRAEDGGEQVYLERTLPGAGLRDALQAALEEAITRLPIPKMMSYQLADGQTTVLFVRPAHGLVALHGTAVVDVGVLGLRAGRVTQGHRFQGARDIEVPSALAYEESLAAHGKVTASFDARRAEIARQLRDAAAGLKASLGDEQDMDALLDEVTALVEQPCVYAASFEPEFLEVPQECLILTMRQNQKYFPLFDAAGKLTPHFLIVSNMRLDDASNVIDGNRRVVRPRLADARFFYQTDRKARLDSRLPQLATVVYHNKLGTQLERNARVRTIARVVATLTGADAALAERAAELSKADLATGMVGEFPELQGVMGRYYALADGEDARVADAVEQHYRPRFAGDVLPTDPVAVALAMADKLEVLAGLFAIGQQPTGDKDPYALRRQALGVLRMLVEKSLPVALDRLVDESLATMADKAPEAARQAAREALLEFLFDRLRGYLRERGYATEEIEAVLGLRPMRIDQVTARLEAVRAFSALPEAASLAAANKRIANILRKAPAGDGAPADALLVEPAERALAASIAAIRPDAQARFAAGDYAGTLLALAAARDSVDGFFKDVMVMAEDPALRANRLALLRELHALMNQVADLSGLAA